MRQYEMSTDNGIHWYPVLESAVRNQADMTPGPEYTMAMITFSGKTGWQVGYQRFRLVEVSDADA